MNNILNSQVKGKPLQEENKVSKNSLILVKTN